MLVRVTSEGKAQPVPITHERTLVGRLDDCQVRIRSGKVSRHHCELVKTDDSLTIKDLGSSNGTFVNQDRISEMALSAGDLVSVGSMVFMVQIDGNPEEFDPEFLFEEGLPEQQSAPSASTPAAAPAASSAPSVSEPVHQNAPTSTGDDSSMMDFNFEFDLDDEEQPPL